MSKLDMRETTITNLTNGVSLFSPDSKALDSPVGKETSWQNNDFSTWLNYYKTDAQLKQTLLALGTWAFGKGYNANTPTNLLLERITGSGEDTFSSICMQMLVMKKLNGDAYAEIIRTKSGTLLNLKPLNPGNVKVVFNEAGIIIRYEMLDQEGQTTNKIKPEDMFHTVNDRLGDEIHGLSVVENIQWALDAKQEAMNDWRRIEHRATIRIMYADDDNDFTLDELKLQYKDAIDKGELLILPGSKKDMELTDINVPPITSFIEWIRYLDNYIYQVIGVPKIIATSEGFTEAGGKVGFLTFEPVYTKEQTELEKDLWNQIAIKVKFNRPPSLQDNVQEDEAKNVGQAEATQPNDTNIGAGE